MLLCVWPLSLSLIPMRFTHVVVCIHGSSPLLPSRRPVVWLHYNRLVRSLVDGRLGCLWFALFYS